MDSESQEKFIKEIILKNFLFLETDFGYSSVLTQENSKVFLRSYTVEYTNSTAKRQVDIGYTSNIVDEEMRHTFSGSILRVPYAGIEDFFSLNMYLRSIGENILFSFNGDFDYEKAGVITQNMSALLKKYTTNIITGKTWLDGFYPRKD